MLRPCLPGRAPLATALTAALCSGCARFVNDRGTQAMGSGETTMVARSRSDLQIECLRPGQPEARGTLISRANVGLAGNLFFGGALVMDRRDEVDGKPLLGRDPAPRTP